MTDDIKYFRAEVCSVRACMCLLPKVVKIYWLSMGRSSMCVYSDQGYIGWESFEKHRDLFCWG